MTFFGRKKYKRLFYLTKMYSQYLDEPHKKEILTINNIESKLWLFEVVPFLSWTVLKKRANIRQRTDSIWNICQRNGR